ncbi:MAG: glycosyltransferase family 4 protein [Thiobacillus sp.]|nr:glycosyltransferase family 4 protein [Thiobacillus sp.]
MKVAHVVRQYHPSVGGMEGVVQNIAQQQMERHDQLPVILTLDRLFRNSAGRLVGKEVIDGVPVIRLPYRGSSRYPLCPDVLDHVRDADVIHVHGIDFFFDFLAATRPIHRRPMVVSTHGGFFHTRFASTLKNIYFNTATRLSALAYDRVVATSDNDGEIFNAIVKSPKKLVIENGVNVEKYADTSAQALTPVLIYFGRWSENKGLLETIVFFRCLVSRQPSWKLIIAGREYDHTEKELMALLQKHQLVESVQLAPNPSDHELAGLIGQSSYFICLSRHEGFGIAPIEAMSAGLTPVLSDIAPFRNLIEQAGMGVLLDQQDVESRVAALLALHSQGEHAYVRRRTWARSFAERYNWKHIADKYVDIYLSLANRKRRVTTCS